MSNNQVSLCAELKTDIKSEMKQMNAQNKDHFKKRPAPYTAIHDVGEHDSKRKNVEAKGNNLSGNGLNFSAEAELPPPLRFHKQDGTIEREPTTIETKLFLTLYVPHTYKITSILDDIFHCPTTDIFDIKHAFDGRFGSIEKPPFLIKHEGGLLCNIENTIVEATSLLEEPLRVANSTEVRGLKLEKQINMRLNAALKAKTEWKKQGTFEPFESVINQVEGPDKKTIEEYYDNKEWNQQGTFLPVESLIDEEKGSDGKTIEAYCDNKKGKSMDKMLSVTESVTALNEAMRWALTVFAPLDFVPVMVLNDKFHCASTSNLVVTHAFRERFEKLVPLHEDKQCFELDCRNGVIVPNKHMVNEVTKLLEQVNIKAIQNSKLARAHRRKVQSRYNAAKDAKVQLGRLLETPEQRAVRVVIAEYCCQNNRQLVADGGPTNGEPTMKGIHSMANVLKSQFDIGKDDIFADAGCSFNFIPAVMAQMLRCKVFGIEVRLF
jgi:hypothetical protein